MDDDDIPGGSVPIDDDQPAPRKRGRPQGSKTRPKDTILTIDKLNELYNKIYPFLSMAQRKYIRGVISGEREVDPLREMELLVQQCSMMFSEAAIYCLDQKTVTMNIAKFGDTLNKAIKDLYDMRCKEEERLAKKEEADEKVSIVTDNVNERLAKFGIEEM